MLLRECFHFFSVDGRAKRRNNNAFSNVPGLVWTRPYSLYPYPPPSLSIPPSLHLSLSLSVSCVCAGLGCAGTQGLMTLSDIHQQESLAFDLTAEWLSGGSLQHDTANYTPHKLHTQGNRGQSRNSPRMCMCRIYGYQQTV